MKKMMFIALAAMVILSVPSCSGEKDPIQTAVIEKILSENQQVVKFEFTKFEKIKDVTLADELTRRQSLFVTKEKTHAKKVAEYSRKKMQANVNKNEEKRAEAAKIIGRIEVYREAHAAQMDSVIYSIYSYDGFGKTSDGGKVVAEGQFVTVSPDGTVYRIQPAGGNPSKGMGVAIPGYYEEILGREAEVGEE